MDERNVLGGELEECGTDPMTGYFRDGCCRPDPAAFSTHLVCGVMTEDFLAHQVSIGNDLVTPRPHLDFAGVRPGDRWCVTAQNWLKAYEDGAACFVVLAATSERALDLVPLAALRELAVDVPSDPGALGPY